MKKFSLLVFAAALAVSSGHAAPAFGADITVSAAASLTNAMTEIRAAFEKSHPGVTVSTNFAASNPLLQQMREGAPVDVFASADQATMDKAQQENLIDPATRRNFVSNSLVLIVPAGGVSPVKGVSDLEKARRLAVGNPDSVPAGRYARDSLTSLGKWEALQPAFIMGESVRQVLDYVSRGEVDAGFVYATDAFVAGDKVDIVATMTGHEPVLYPVAVTASAGDKQLAGSFEDFLFSAEGMAILRKFGFSEAK